VYVTKIPNRSAGLVNMGSDDDVENRRVWESIGGSISASCTRNLEYISFEDHNIRKIS
jgi:hypothetical protein